VKFVAHSDLDAPIADVFAALTDFAAYERMALRRGVRVQRLAGEPAPGTGSGWDTRFMFRGREIRAVSHISVCEPPERLALDGRSGGYEFDLATLLVALSRDRTRLRLDLDVRPKTLGARIILQTLKLGKSRLQTRFQMRADRLAAFLSQRIAESRPVRG